MENDPLKEVRSVRRMISAECGNDPDKVFEYYRKHQEEAKRSGRYKFVTTRRANVPAARATEQSDAAEP